MLFLLIIIAFYISIYDIKFYKIQNTSIIILLICILCYLYSNDNNYFFNLTNFIIPTLFVVILIIVGAYQEYKKKVYLGLGDIKLFVVTSLYLQATILTVLFIMSILALLFIAVYVKYKDENVNAVKLPLAPFYFLSILIVVYSNIDIMNI